MEPIIVSDCEILGKSNWTYSIKYRLTITIFFLNVMKLLYKISKDTLLGILSPFSRVSLFLYKYFYCL